MSSPKIPKYPQPTQQQNDLMAAQTEALNRQSQMIEQQYAAQNLLAPYMYKSMGLTPKYDANGNLTGFDQAPQDIEQQQIQQLSQERTLAALRGELPVDAGLMNELAKEDKVLNETLTKQLGPGWATSTPGIQAATEWAKQRSAILDAARRGDLTTAEAINLAQTQAMQQQTAAFLGEAAGVSSLSGGAAALYGQNAAGYTSPLQYLANLQNAQYQNKMMRYLYAPPSPVLGILQGGMQGASAGGAAGGPWGALAGGILGAGMGAAGNSMQGGPLARGSGGGGMSSMIPGMGAGVGGMFGGGGESMSNMTFGG